MHLTSAVKVNETSDRGELAFFQFLELPPLEDDRDGAYDVDDHGETAGDVVHGRVDLHPVRRSVLQSKWNKNP